MKRKGKAENTVVFTGARNGQKHEAVEGIEPCDMHQQQRKPALDEPRNRSRTSIQQFDVEKQPLYDDWKFANRKETTIAYTSEVKFSC